MNKVKKIVGYDPGGNNRHGVAILSVSRDGNRWVSRTLELETHSDTQAVIDCISAKAPGGQLLAVGIDTLTAWSTGSAGLRPADKKLRERYTAVAKSVDHANHINGSMCLNGALILQWLSQWIERGGEVTEAHPKVLFYALRKQRHPWSKTDASPSVRPVEAAGWLIEELGISEHPEALAACDHKFDALLGAMAALRGLNREWTTDLHAGTDVIHPFGQTHFWWPEDISKAAKS